MSILQKWPPYKLHKEMPEDSENASLLGGDLGSVGAGLCWFRTEIPMQIVFDQHNRRETACAGLQTLCCVVAGMQQNAKSIGVHERLTCTAPGSS